MVETFATTRLDAINEILSVIGEAPVNSEVAASAAVVLAGQFLDRANRHIQGLGWHWNTERNEEITADGSGFYNTKANWIRIDAVPGRYPNMDLVKRGDKIYDLFNRTFVLGTSTTGATTTIGTLYVDVVKFLDWDELPQAVREWVTMRGGRMFHDRYLGTVRHHGWFEADELEAKTRVVEDELEVADPTWFNTPLMQGILRRGRAPLRDFQQDVGGLTGGGGPLPPV